MHKLGSKLIGHKVDLCSRTTSSQQRCVDTMIILDLMWLVRWVLGAALISLFGCGPDVSDATVFEQLGLVTAPSERSAWIEEELAFERAAADKAAFCMSEQGYEYVAWSPAEVALTPSLDAPKSGTLEFAERRGYGILYSLPASLRTHPSAKADPNAPFVDGLSPDQWHAYHQTLLGANGSPGPREPSVPEALYRDGGCLGRELRGNSEQNALLGQLHEAFSDVTLRANADSRLLDYDKAWSLCMARSGHRYESSSTARDAFGVLRDELWSGASFPIDGIDRESLRQLSRAEREGLYSVGVTIDEKLWAAYLDNEIAVATADWRCQDQSPRYDIYQEVLRDLEEAFTEDNRTLIERLTTE